MSIDGRRRHSTEHLLPTPRDQSSAESSEERQNAMNSKTDSPYGPSVNTGVPDVAIEPESPRATFADFTETPELVYRVYKRRFFGLTQLILLNIIISWDWLTFSPVSTSASEYFGVSESSINWLSTGFLFAFVFISPVVIYTLNKGGPKASIITASVLVLIGNWIRYAGTRASGGNFAVVMVGQIIIGLAQPFVLSAPTRFSNLWFSDSGRVMATAVASLANPFGGALGQLIGPLWATNVDSIPNMVLYTTILSTIAALPSFFIPACPPSPPSAIAASTRLSLRRAFKELPTNTSFYLIFLPFSVYVGQFNAFSSLLNQVFEPYGFSETDAGIAGALLIVVGLVASGIVSPYVDRSKKHQMTIKVMVPIIAAMYLTLIWMPATRSVIGPYIVCGILGAASFSLLPCALEYLVIITHPVSPEISSTLCWTGGQMLGAIFILVMDALKGAGPDEPRNSMQRALIFQAAMAWIVVPLPLMLGWWKFQQRGLVRLNSAEST